MRLLNVCFIMLLTFAVTLTTGCGEEPVSIPPQSEASLSTVGPDGKLVPVPPPAAPAAAATVVTADEDDDED